MLAQLVEDLEQLGADKAAKEERLQAGSLQLRQLLAASSQPPRIAGSQQGQGGSQVLVTALSSPTQYYCANISQPRSTYSPCRPLTSHWICSEAFLFRNNLQQSNKSIVEAACCTPSPAGRGWYCFLLAPVAETWSWNRYSRWCLLCFGARVGLLAGTW